MRSARSLGQGVGLTGTTSFFSVKGIFGFGLLNLILGGIVLFSRASTALIKLEIPEAPSEWPTFGFT